MTKSDQNEEQDINELLASYAADATQFIASTSTLKKLTEMGLKLDKPLEETADSYIDRIFEERKKVAKEVIASMPTRPNIPLPPIISLYDEISECILFGLNGAAISLSAVLVEFAIKHAIVDHKKGTELYDKAEWNRVEKKELGPIIGEAEELGLFDEEDIKKLIHFKNTIRNPYLHYNIKEITKDVIMQEAFAYNAETNKVEKKFNLRAEDNPFLWELGKRKVDEGEVLGVFNFADSVVRALFPASSFKPNYN